MFELITAEVLAYAVAGILIGLVLTGFMIAVYALWHVMKRLYFSASEVSLVRRYRTLGNCCWFLGGLGIAGLISNVAGVEVAPLVAALTIPILLPLIVIALTAGSVITDAAIVRGEALRETTEAELAKYEDTLHRELARVQSEREQLAFSEGRPLRPRPFQ